MYFSSSYTIFSDFFGRISYIVVISESKKLASFQPRSRDIEKKEYIALVKLYTLVRVY